MTSNEPLRVTPSAGTAGAAGVERLRIEPGIKERPNRSWWMILGVIVAIIAVVIGLSLPKASDNVRLVGSASSREAAVAKADRELAGRATVESESRRRTAASTPLPSSGTAGNPDSASSSAPARVDGSLLTVSGHIVAHERIELSPRFMGIVSWIGVKKGDPVQKGQVVVRLDDSEYQARLAENDGQLAVARVALDKARLDLRRYEELVAKKVEMVKNLDDARLAVATAEAQILQIQGARKLIETWMDWCVIHSPVDGVVLEKLAKANELVSPQTFGGTRGPSTSLLAVADLNDLQVEVDVNESALGKIGLGQKCKVSPEAYPELQFDGTVAEIAPEANRAKGTLQIKVQILRPDRHLTPELSAKVDFLP